MKTRAIARCIISQGSALPNRRPMSPACQSEQDYSLDPTLRLKCARHFGAADGNLVKYLYCWNMRANPSPPLMRDAHGCVILTHTPAPPSLLQRSFN